MIGPATEVLVLGHPFASIGMGEQARACIRALQAVGITPQAYDIFRHSPRSDPAHRALIDPIETRSTDATIRIFHINGDEIAPVLARLQADGFDMGAGINVICPAWELPEYPRDWAAEVDRFDAVWAISRFVEKALLGAVTKPVSFVGQAVERPLPSLLPRRHFGIPESSYTFLSLFDYSSYRSRKNPDGALAAFRRLRDAQPEADIHFVLKAGGKPKPGEALPPLKEEPRVTLLQDELDTRGVYSLFAACDCLVSAHRSEGFGRGPAEAMLLGKTVIATGYSGVTDYLDDGNALTVRFGLEALREGDYPKWHGQHWASPDAEHLYARMHEAWSRRAQLAPLHLRARREVIARTGNRAVGLRMLDQLILLEARALSGQRTSSN